jgi:hypothetical protein
LASATGDSFDHHGLPVLFSNMDVPILALLDTSLDDSFQRNVVGGSSAGLL